jgi:serine/threonine-protein kinase
MLTGRAPFEGSNAWEVAVKHQEAPVPSVRAVRPDVPSDLDETIAGSMQKDPGARPSVDSFVRRIEREPSTIPVSATATPAPDATERLPQPVDLRSVALFGSLAVWLSRLRVRLGRAKAKRLLAAATTVVVGAIVAVLGVGMRAPAPEEVSVPDVRGLTTAAAATVLSESRLDIAGVSYVAVTETEPGLVVTTIPGSGEVVQPGTDVHLIAGAEPATPEPVVEDKDEDDDGRGRGNGKRGRD